MYIYIYISVCVCVCAKSFNVHYINNIQTMKFYILRVVSLLLTIYRR